MPYPGNVIGLEFNGVDAVQTCQDVVTRLSAGATGVVFVSPSRETAEQQITNFYDFADMQMNV